MTLPHDRISYFAYGSNMLTRRLARRVVGVRVVGPAWLPGYRLEFNKRGLDGSGKAAIAADGNGGGVHGVLFELPAEARAILDRVEGGYGAETVPVETAGDGGAAPRQALTYVGLAENLAEGLRPFCWYRDFVVHGAREHGLPDAWVRGLEAVGVVEDPDPVRLRGNRSILAP